ncbi:MAG TPA: LPS export ABC transporter permease LptF [Moraxellaceae bacterium]|nr:LPS export ABC transporter permease LptF [Moraxellaceae bacterium]
MIIRRYLSLQVLGTTAAVTLVLTVILMSGRVIKYFGMAADGRMEVKLLTAVLLYRLPGFLDLIVPLSLFIAVLLTFGRLYLDNEMSVLHASGVSRAQIVGHLLVPIIVVMAVVSFTSLYVTPTGNAAAERLFAEQAQKNTFDLVRPGRFQTIGRYTLFAGELSPDKQRLLDVRLFDSRRPQGKPVREVMVKAAVGSTRRDAGTGERFLVLENGVRYEMVPGDAAYRELRFSHYEMRLPEPAAVEGVDRLSSYTTLRLLAERGHNRAALGEWVWRLSLPLFIPAATLLAFALSRVNPRQGRYLKLLPAVLLYMTYVVAVGAARNAIDKGKGGEAAVWAVHAGYLMVALALLGQEQIRQMIRQWRDGRGVAA